MNLLETAYYKNYKLEVYADDWSESPREWCNLATLVSIRLRNWRLGDVQCDNADDVIHYIAKQVYPNLDDETLENMKGLEIEELVREKAYLYPWYMTDHSTISFSLYQTCRWDSGQIGLIYIPFEKIENEYETTLSEERVLEIVQSELRTYEDYVNGNIYGYRLYQCPEVIDFNLVDEVEYEEIDDCWGYIGLDDIKQGIQSDVKHGDKLLQQLPTYF